MATREYCFSEDGADCPYCGYVNDPANSDYILYDEKIERYECGSCEREFSVSLFISHSWTTRPIPQEAPHA